MIGGGVLCRARMCWGSGDYSVILAVLWCINNLKIKKVMKKFATVVLAICVVSIFSAVSFSSCIEQREPAFLSFSKTGIAIDSPKDTSFLVMLTYSNDWTIDPIASDWCTVSPMQGKGNAGLSKDSVSLVVTVGANTTSEVRRTDIVVRSVNLKLALPIQQAK